MSNLTNVVFTLIDRQEALVKAWRDEIIGQQGFENFEVLQGDIFSFRPVPGPGLIALVSPANSFGDMNGGIDLVYTMEFGDDLQKHLQTEIYTKKYGELIVGDALIINIPRTYRGTVPISLLISAPTMRHPSVVSNTMNAYLAFRAVLIQVYEYNRRITDKNLKIKQVICPGLGTAIGKIPVIKCAQQMYLAWTNIHYFNANGHRQNF